MDNMLDAAPLVKNEMGPNVANVDACPIVAMPIGASYLRLPKSAPIIHAS